MAAVGLLIFVAVCSTAGTIGSAGGLSAVRLGEAPMLPASATLAAELPGTTPLNVDVVLNSRDPAGLAAYARSVSTPGSADFGHDLTVSQFASRFGASPSSIEAIDSDLASAGLQAGTPSANDLSIPVDATATQLSSAFSTSFRQYRIGGGRLAYANTAAPQLSGSIAPLVQTVIGLDDLTVASPALETSRAQASTSGQPIPHVVTGGPQPCSTAVNISGSGSYTTDQVASAYSFSSLYGQGDLGSGQTVALYELQGFSATDASAYQTCYGTSTAVSTVNVDGGPLTGSGDGEADVDIEQVASLAPKVKIIVYQGPNGGSGGYDTYSTIFSQDLAKTVSTSWGACDLLVGSAYASAENTLFQEAATQGQTVVAASGDQGSEDCLSSDTTDESLAVDDPASQPYVTGAGGTEWSALATPPAESAWNDGPTCCFGSGGGGLSSIWTMPTFQSSSKVAGLISANSSGSPCGASLGNYCREVPDVSSLSGSYPYIFYVDGGWEYAEGTSLSAPLWASMFSLSDASKACVAKNIGFANPILYGIAASAPTDFNDVLKGNNDLTGLNKDLYPAGAGYDMATGLGTPNGSALPSALCSAAGKSFPAVTSVSPTSGPTSGGTTVTVTGTGFTGTTKVLFGTVPAVSFTVVSDTKITAVSPAEPAALHNVFVTTPNGTSPTVTADQFTFKSAPPAVTSVSPTSGPTSGGTTVTITGTGFTGTTKVLFGVVAATSYTVVSDTKITAVSPAQAAATHNIYVTTLLGTSAAVPADDFTYVGKPALTAVSPTSGPTTGGTTVTITGTGFTGTTKVLFGVVAATSYTVVSDTKITAVSPAQAAAIHNIYVTTLLGTSAAVPADDFTYVGKPALTAVSPTSGPTTGGHDGNHYRDRIHRNDQGALRCGRGDQLHRRQRHQDHRRIARSGGCNSQHLRNHAARNQCSGAGGRLHICCMTPQLIILLGQSTSRDPLFRCGPAVVHTKINRPPPVGEVGVSVPGPSRQPSATRTLAEHG